MGPAYQQKVVSILSLPGEQGGPDWNGCSGPDLVQVALAVPWGTAPWRTASPVPTCSAWVWAEPCHPFRPRPPQSASVGVPGPSRPPVRPLNQRVCFALDVSFVYPWGRASGEGRRTHRGSVLRRRFEETACEPQFPQALLHSRLVPPGASLLSLGTRSHTCAFLSKQATRSKPDGEAEAEAEMGRVRAGAGGPAVRPAGRRARGMACA